MYHCHFRFAAGALIFPLTVYNGAVVPTSNVSILPVAAHDLKSLTGIVEKQGQTAIIRMRPGANTPLERVDGGRRVVQTRDEVILLRHKGMKGIGLESYGLGQNAQQFPNDAVARLEECGQFPPHRLRVGIGEPLVRLRVVVVAVNAEELFEVRRVGIGGQFERAAPSLARASPLVHLPEDRHLLGFGLGEEGARDGEEPVDAVLSDSRLFQIDEPVSLAVSVYISDLRLFVEVHWKLFVLLLGIYSRTCHFNISDSTGNGEIHKSSPNLSSLNNVIGV